MLLDNVKIVGMSEGSEVIQISITHLCEWDVVQQLCDLLRQNAHKLGTELSFEITSIVEDI